MKTISGIKLITLALSSVMVACNKFEDHVFFYYNVDFPEVITYAADNVTSHTANLSGCITSTGNGIISTSGIYIYGSDNTPPWNQVPHAEFQEKRYSESNSVGVFSVFLSDLRPNTTYHYRAFATNEDGTSYGEMMILVTPDGIASDNNGNIRPLN